MGSTTGIYITSKRNITQNTVTSYNSLNSQNVRYLVTNRALQTATYIAPFCIICIRRWAVRLAFTGKRNITQNTVTSYNSLNSQNVRYLVTNYYRELQTATYSYFMHHLHPKTGIYRQTKCYTKHSYKLQ